MGDPSSYGCPDKSDVSMDANPSSNNPCGDTYNYNDFGKKTVDVTWEWFHCNQTNKCIHMDSRCDLHPHPECIYKNNKGESVAEDEEGCSAEDYQIKGLLAKSANFQCQSALHNENSSAVLSTVFNWTRYFQGGSWDGSHIPNVTVIGNGTRVHTFATRCNSIQECYDNSDEDSCGFNTDTTVAMGKSMVIL